MTVPDALYINAGIQLQYGRSTPPTREGYVPPTRTFGCVPPFTHLVTQPVAGLSLENPQCPRRGTLSPDRSEYSIVELLRTGSRRGFSPVCGVAASPTRSWT